MPASTDVIKCICELPRRFRQVQKKTVFQLLDEKDVFEHLMNIPATDLEQHLFEHPELIEDWLLYSEDQRCSPSHYLVKMDDGFEVGRAPRGIKTHYSDPAKACAAFVTRFLDRLLDVRAKEDEQHGRNPCPAS